MKGFAGNGPHIAWRPGTIVMDLYQVGEPLGRGGSGEVFRVRHLGWEIDLAVKRPHAQFLARPGAVERFEKECETWVNLPLHPNVVPCYYIRRINGVPHVFAEYVRGGSLAQWIHQRALYAGGPSAALVRILDIAIQVAWALDFGHENGIVHRDVKPGNVMMTRSGIPKVTDFGIAQAVEQASGKNHEGSMIVAFGVPGATLQYCSPEQARREPSTFVTDVYSLAVSVLHMFTGEVTWLGGPMAAGTLAALDEVGPDSEFLPSMPASLRELLEDCLHSDPTQRPQSMSEVASRLETIHAAETGLPYGRARPAPELDAPERLNNRGASMMDLGDHRKALALWQKALKGDPRHIEANFNNALLLWRDGAITDRSLVRLVRQQTTERRGSWFPLYLLAEVHIERGAYAEAEETLAQIEGTDRNRREIAKLRGIIKRYKARSREPLREFGRPGGEFTAALLSWDGAFAFTAESAAHQPAAITRWNCASGERAATFQGHEAPVNALALNADGTRVVSASEDETVRIWDVLTGTGAHVFAGHRGGVADAALTADGHEVISGGADGELRIWSVSRGECVESLSGHFGAIHAIQLTADDRIMISAGDGGAIIVWDRRNRTRVRVISGIDCAVTALSPSRDGTLLFAGDANGILTLWEIPTGKMLGQLHGHKTSVSSVHLSPDGQYLLSASVHGSPKLWEVASNRCIYTLDGRAPASLSGDGRFALIRSSEAGLRLWAIFCDAAIRRAPFVLCRT